MANTYLGDTILDFLVADFGDYPDITSLYLGSTTVELTGFNPTALGIGTGQAFADALAVRITTELTTKFGAGNFSAVTCTYEDDGTNASISISNLTQTGNAMNLSVVLYDGGGGETENDLWLLLETSSSEQGQTYNGSIINRYTNQ